MDPSVQKRVPEMSGVVTDNPTSYLKTLLGDYSAWNKEILFPDLDQEYGEVQGSPLDVSGASMVDNQSEIEKTGHVMHPIESESNPDIHIGVKQIHSVTPTKATEPDRTITMDQAYITQPETLTQCGTVANYQEDKATDADLGGIPYTEFLPLFSEAMGSPDSNQTQTQRIIIENPEQLQTSSQISFTNGVKDAQPAADSPIYEAVPLQPDLSHDDLNQLLQLIFQFEPAYQPTPTSGTGTYVSVPSVPDGTIAHTLSPLSGSPTADSMMESGSSIPGSTTDPSMNNTRAEWSMAESGSAIMGTPMDPLTSNSSAAHLEIVDFLSAPSQNSAGTSLISTQTMIDVTMDLADRGVPYQQHTASSSFIGDIPSPEPETNSATATAAHDVYTSVSVKEGLKSKIQLKRLQRGEKELRVSFLNKPAGKLTEEEKQKIVLRKQKNKDSANRSRLHRQEKMKRLIQENAEAEKEVEKLRSEVEKSTKVRDVLQHWWDRRICHLATGFRKPPNQMGINDLLDALEKYLASEAKV
ncbi:uncharacterized protein LOC124146349 [Haliotis rufescens]|uniref:uncharacterized protein LOC124146349 n=1 Tax=Haliotis rufescens TaxID=6454 RepID=UPI001EB040EB|nr:uncharacterized protein LOC124146349 [Haliotis rufescens]